jgi:hypothetical protein
MTSPLARKGLAYRMHQLSGSSMVDPKRKPADAGEIYAKWPFLGIPCASVSGSWANKVGALAQERQ